MNPSRAGKAAVRLPFAEDRITAAASPGGVPPANPAIQSRFNVGSAAGKDIKFKPQMIPDDRVGRFNPRAKAGRNATQTGLVYARPDSIDQGFLRSSGAFGKSDPIIEHASRSIKELGGINYTRSPMRTAGNAFTNIRTDRALKQAAGAGLRGQEALDFVFSKVPAARDRVGLPLSKEMATSTIKSASDDPITKGTFTKGSTSPGIMSREQGRGFKRGSNLGKTARNVVRFAPVVGGIFDAKELYDEIFNEDDVEVQEVVGAVLDLAIGVTGVGGIIGDVIGISAGSDGLGSAIVDGIGSFTGWWDPDED